MAFMTILLAVGRSRELKGKAGKRMQAYATGTAFPRGGLKVRALGLGSLEIRGLAAGRLYSFKDRGRGAGDALAAHCR